VNEPSLLYGKLREKNRFAAPRSGKSFLYQLIVNQMRRQTSHRQGIFDDPLTRHGRCHRSSDYAIIVILCHTDLDLSIVESRTSRVFG